MPHPFQWSKDDDDDDDEVYGGHKLQHCSGTRLLSVLRLLTFIVQR